MLTCFNVLFFKYNMKKLNMIIERDSNKIQIDGKFQLHDVDNVLILILCIETDKTNDSTRATDTDRSIRSSASSILRSECQKCITVFFVPVASHGTWCIHSCYCSSTAGFG